MDSPRVFISYANHKSGNHCYRVLALAEALERYGIEVIFDQYEPNQPLPWAKWMESAVKNADFVLCVCDERYCERFLEEQNESEGLGVQYEGTLISNTLSGKRADRMRFLVLQFDQIEITQIPLCLRGNNRYAVKTFTFDDGEFERLYRVITNQPESERPTRGDIVRLPLKEPRAPRLHAPVEAMRIEYGSVSGEEISPARVRFEGRTIPGKGDFLRRKALQSLQGSMAAFNNLDYPRALQLATNALSADGSLSYALYVAGRASFHVGEYDNAVTLLKGYTVEHAEDLSARMWLQRARSANGESDALLLASECYAENSENPSVVIGFCNLLMDMGKVAQAEQEFLKFFGRTHDSCLESQRAVCLWRLGKVEDSILLLEAVKPKTAVDWLNLGVGHAEAGRFGMAIECLTQGLELQPSNQFGKFALAEIYSLTGDVEACLMKLLELHRVGSVYVGRLADYRTFDRVRSDPGFAAMEKALSKKLR
ncbi:MAG: SEFIR domain-containing protein [Fimbriimonadales bacterium]